MRERAFSRFPRETQALFKVVGIADLVVWKMCKATWTEMAPATIKKLLTGSGKADKETVAKALTQYVGHHLYASDDESDAVATGIA